MKYDNYHSEEYPKECIPANMFFFFAFKREVRKNVFCLLASFDVSFHHSSRFGSTQIQSKKEPCGACPGMLMRPNVLITFP